MKPLIDSAWRAAAYCLHPQVIFYSLLPLALMVGLAFGLGFFFWEPSLDAVRAAFEGWELLKAMFIWLEGIGMDAHLLETSLHVPRQLIMRPRLEMEAEAQPSQKWGVDPHLQTRQELLVADQQQTKGRLGVAAVAAQQPDFLQGGGAQVLGFVQHDDGPEAL